MPKRPGFPACSAAFLLAALLLSACEMPEKPEGADAEGFARIGDQLKKQGDDAGAANFYQRALQRRPDDTGTRKSLAEILEKHGAYPEAETQYAAALKYDPADGDLLRDEGRVELKLGHAEDARASYEKILEDDPHDVKALNGLGIALDYLNRHDAAQKAYRTALEQAPNDYVTLSNLAHSYVLTGNYDEAIKLLEPHALDKKAPPALRQNLAEAYGLAGMEADAERMARMDLPPAEVKRNLAWYRAQRAKLAPPPKPYAELGVFATDEIATARAASIKTALPGEIAGVTLISVPVVKGIGGTPRFSLRATGFTTPLQARAFCERVKKRGLSCTQHEETP